MPPYRERDRHIGLYQVPHYGNYVGPYWSAGKRQASVAYSKVPAINEFDWTAKYHDQAYKLNKDLNMADDLFYRQNIGKGVLRTGAAIGVKAQSLMRIGVDGTSKEIQLYDPVTDLTVYKARNPSIFSSSKNMNGYPVRRKRRRSSTGLTRSGRRYRRTTTRRTKRTPFVPKRRPTNVRRKKTSRRKTMKRRRSMKRGYRRRRNIAHFSHKVIERGGTYSDPQALYIGAHNTPFVEIFKSICRSLIKKLFQQKGESFTDFNQIIDTHPDLKLAYLYWPTPSSTQTTTVIVTFTAGTDSYLDLAEALYTSFVSQFSNDSGYRLEKMVLYDDTSADQSTVATLRGADLKIHLSFSSQMKIQNRTLATTGGTAEDEDVSNIYANPIVGYLYEGRGNGPQLRQRTSDATEVTVLTLGSPSTGLNAFAAGDFVLAENQARLNKPPPKSYFKNCRKMTKVLIQPGKILMTKNRGTAKMAFNTFLQKFLVEVNTPTTRRYTSLGSWYLFGLEKVIDVRSAEPDVSIGYETVTTIGSYVTYNTNQKVERIVEIN